MPIYEYLCHDCGARIELMRSMKDADAPTKCAKCESQNMTRLLSLFNASSGGRVVTGGGGSCSGCAGGSCSSCGH